MISRLLKALISGIIFGFVVFVIIAIVAALLPGIELSASAKHWSIIAGLLFGLYVLLTGDDKIL